MVFRRELQSDRCLNGGDHGPDAVRGTDPLPPGRLPAFQPVALLNFLAHNACTYAVGVIYSAF